MKDWAVVVRQLLEKANSTDIEAEAEAFREKAFELIHKHGIDMERVKTAGIAEKYIQRSTMPAQLAYTPGRWAMYLASAVGKFTATFSMSYADGCIAFAGPAARVELAVDIFQLWSAELLNQCAVDSKGLTFYSQKNKDAPHRRVWRGHYMIAATSRVFMRVDAMSQKLDKQTTAIVLNERDDIRSWVESRSTLTAARSSKSTLSHSAAILGRQAGDSLAINPLLEVE